MADLERRLIWPDTEFLPPDILLSIGTSCSNKLHKEAQDSFHVFQQESDPMRPRLSSAVGTHQQRRKTTQMRKVIKILKNRVENILDTELSWLKFMSDATRGDELASTRYRRINPDIGEYPPKLDDVKKLPNLRRRMHQIMKYADFQKKVQEIARQLVASSFYIDVPYLPANPQDFNTSVSGMSSPFHSETELI